MTGHFQTKRLSVLYQTLRRFEENGYFVNQHYHSKSSKNLFGKFMPYFAA